MYVVWSRLELFRFVERWSGILFQTKRVFSTNQCSEMYMYVHTDTRVRVRTPSPLYTLSVWMLGWILYVMVFHVAYSMSAGWKLSALCGHSPFFASCEGLPKISGLHRSIEELSQQVVFTFLVVCTSRSVPGSMDRRSLIRCTNHCIHFSLSWFAKGSSHQSSRLSVFTHTHTHTHTHTR